VNKAQDNLPSMNGFDPKVALVYAVLAVAMALRGLWQQESKESK
jgi:hypothetical protein